jgi:hypothetical protein
MQKLTNIEVLTLKMLLSALEAELATGSEWSGKYKAAQSRGDSAEVTRLSREFMLYVASGMGR